jgi:DNA replication protein DnaC
MTDPENAACPECGDTGWIVAEADGRRLARRCACHAAKKAVALLDQSRIPRRYQNCSLANFEVHNESHGDALKIARQFVKNYPVQDVGLLFLGPCGVGKTHLAVAILRDLISSKKASCLFYDFRDLIWSIQSTFSADSDLSGSDVLAPVFESQVLVLDELGAKRSSAWVEETIFYIINHRYNTKTLTIFTSNYLDTEEEEDKRQPMFRGSSFRDKGPAPAEESLVSRIGHRLRSRIYEMCKVVPLTGPDYRKIAKQASYRF